MRTRYGTICVAAVLASASAAAGTVYLKSTGDNNASAFSSGAYWGDGTGTIDGGTDYAVANGFRLLTPDQESTFAGHSLQIGDGTAGTLVVRGNATKQTFTKLVLAKGSCVDWRSGNKSETIAGPVTLTAPSSDPFSWSGSPYLNPTYSGVYFEDAITAASGTKIVFADNGQPDYHVDLKGSLADFGGIMEMRTSRSGFYSDSAGGTRLVIYPSSGSSTPGTLSFTAGTSLFPSDKTVDFTIGTLQMATGSRMRVIGDSTGVHSIFKVSDSFVFSAEDGGVILEVSELYKAADTLRTAIFSAPVSSGFTDKTFRTAGDDGAAAFPRYTLECEDADGIRTLYLVTRVVDPVNTSVSHNNCLNLPSMWQSGILSTYDAATTHDFFANKWIKTSNVASDKAFSGSATLTLGAEATLAIENPRLTVSEFDLLNGAKISDDGYYWNTTDSVLAESGASGLKTVRGAIRSPWKDWEVCNLVGKAGYYFLHDGTLTGGGTVYIHNAVGANNAYYELRGSNSGFFGGIKFGTDSSGVGNACLVVNNAANLGGPCKSFRADALTLSYGAVLWPKESMTLAEPTRGVTIEQDSVVRTDYGIVLTIAESTVWKAALTKTEAGTLALGGAASVPAGSESAAALTISAGAFKPLSTNALAGVALEFGTGTELKIAVPAADEGMRDRGIVLDSVILPESGFSVSLDIDEEALSAFSRYSVAICTVPSESAAALRSALAVGGVVLDFNVRLEERANGDGTTTFLAKFCKGIMLIVF